MSKMRTNLRPPLPRSPIRLRSRRVLQPNSAVQTPPGSMTKSLKPARFAGADLEPQIRPEFNLISCELRALAKMVRVEVGNEEIMPKSPVNHGCLGSVPLFERGRFYDEYSARRNERLRRKKVEIPDEIKATPHTLRVSAEPTKRRGTAKKMDGLKRSFSAAYSVERNVTTPRYALRSMTKENKKPPLPVVESYGKIATTRRLRKV